MTSESKKRKIVVYSHDTFGLGNIRRMLAIAKAMVVNNPNVSILILSGSPILHAFRIPSQIDYIKLPCLTRTVNEDYKAKFLNLKIDNILRLRGNIIQSAIFDFDPDLILVDKKPFGVSDELQPTLKALRRQNHKAKLVLLLRDILDRPETTMRIWQKNQYHSAIANHYDEVLVVGNPEIFDLRHEYQFPQGSYHKVRYCGYLSSERGKTSRTELRSQLGCLANEQLVLVTPGGGKDGYQLLNAYVNGMLSHAPSRLFKSLIICGPEMAEEQRGHIQALLKNRPDVIVQHFTDDMMAYMNAADLVISMGGYNTVCELLTLNKRAIVVPRVNPEQEQWLRAERMDRINLLRALHPKKLNPALLISLVVEELALSGQGQYPATIAMDGLHEVCKAINQLLCGNNSRINPVSRNIEN
jgi:predicted glycosyltransferase